MYWKTVYTDIVCKKQIFKVIAQWINGEQNGYCFGFEGSPGVGKTSLAKKGISKCLVDDDGNERPFSFIALGGSSNGSYLEGHGYTYMNSNWGKIVDVLMESKCMNPSYILMNWIR
jgi:ATP-dependent Lon protease